MKRILLALILLAATAGTAGAQMIFIPTYTPPPTPSATRSADYTNIHTVAIISALGTQLTFRNNHFMGPKDHVQDIQDWNIDAEIEVRLKQYLSGRFTFKSVAFDRAALAKIPDGNWDGLLSKFPEFARSLPQDQVDAYIIIRRGLAYQAPGIQGLGLENGGAFRDGTPLVWANFEINIVDARTSKVIAGGYSRVRTRENAPPSFSGLFASDALKVDDNFRLTERQAGLLHADLSALLNLSLVETLRALGLGDGVPAVSARNLAPIPPQRMPYAAIKSVAIVSAIGASLDLEHMATVLDQGSAAFPVPDWQLDKIVETAAANAVAGRFTVNDMPADRAALASATLLNGDGKLDPKLPGLPATQDVDAYIVFVKLPASLPHVNRDAAGAGMWHNSILSIDGTGVFANYAVLLVDAHNLKLIAARGGTVSPHYPQAQPLEDVDDSLWPGSRPVFTPDQAAKVRSALTDLLNDSAAETMLAMGLRGLQVADAPAMPAAN